MEYLNIISELDDLLWRLIVHKDEWWSYPSEARALEAAIEAIQRLIDLES